MERDFLEISYPGPFLFASSAQIQAQVERLVGPLFERRCVKDRRQTKRDLLGRRDSDKSGSSKPVL